MKQDKERDTLSPLFAPVRLGERAMAQAWHKTRVRLDIAAILIIIVVLQNSEPVETRLLFASVTMPRAALLVGTAAAGFLSGWLFARFRSRG